MAANNATLAVAVALVILAAAATGADGAGGAGPRSYLTVWGGPGCTSGAGFVMNAAACGCNNLQLTGGYEFNFRGETATLYDQLYCTGTPYQVFEDTQACDSSFGWQSVYINC